MKLDENQQKSVEYFEGPALVVAGPGSGKTTVIKERILNWIRNHNVDPEHILAIVFTNDAADEMEKRILGELNSNHGYPEIRTLHGFGKDIIIENYERAKFRQEPEPWMGDIDKSIKNERRQIEQEASNASVAIYKIESKRTGKCYIGQTTNPDRRRKAHFDHSSNDRLRQAIQAEGVSQFSFEVIECVPGRKANCREAYWIASYKDREGVFNRGDPEKARYSNQRFLKMFCQHFDIPYTEHLDRDPDFENLRDCFNDIKETVRQAKRQVTTGLFDPKTVKDSGAQAFAIKYEMLKAEANAIDFEDMIIYAANLLKTCPDLQQTYRAKYPYLFVDESQDSPLATSPLIRLLLEDRSPVDDDGQAIDGFGGGDSEEHLTKTQATASKIQNISTRDQLTGVVEIYLCRIIRSYRDRLNLTNNIDKSFIIRNMIEYLLSLDDASVKEIDSFSTKSTGSIDNSRYSDYCVLPDKTRLCSPGVFRNFWEHMWEVVEQSRKTCKPQTEEASVPIPTKTKRSLPSTDDPTAPVKTQRTPPTPNEPALLTTSVEPPKKTVGPAVKTFTDGEIVKGVVVDVNRDEVMIDIGFKSEGYIPASEFEAGEADLPAVQVGDEIDVYIVRREDAEGQIVLSKKIADQTLIWDEIATAYEAGTPVMGRIIERIKGGLRVSVGSLRGFLPASQMESRPIQNLEQYVGQTLEMKVISLSKRRHNIVLSRQAWLEAELVQKRSEVLSTLEVGQQVVGVVKNITAFGAFIDLGGIDGLLHKSEMAWKRVNQPSEIISVGESVKVKVIKIDRENEKISLSLKQMTIDPWKNVEDKYPIGSKVSGVVVNIADYGVFVQLEEGIVGLIHVSEMPLVLNNMSRLDLLNKNDELEVTVLKISRDSQRISLSIK